MGVTFPLQTRGTFAVYKTDNIIRIKRMKKLIIAFVFLSQLLSAQSKGIVKGNLTDGESNNEPLPFAKCIYKRNFFRSNNRF